jgi:Flp pilus assembly protein TadG
MMKGTKRKQTDFGQSLVEMAISVLLLIGLLNLVVDAGRALFAYIALQGAAEEGAAFGSFNPDESDPNEEIEERVRNSSTSFVDLTSESDVIVSTCFPTGVGTCVAFTTQCAGDPLLVTVTNHFDPLMPGVGTFDITVSATSTILAPACP